MTAWPLLIELSNKCLTHKANITKPFEACVQYRYKENPDDMVKDKFAKALMGEKES